MTDSFIIPGPSIDISEEIHSEKYRMYGESFRDAMNRVASALKDDDEHYNIFRELLLNMQFMPAGRVQASMGSTKKITPYNCFVSAAIEDNFTGEGGIMHQATKAVETMRMGGGIGYDFSLLRPRGETIKSLGSMASGPVSFLLIFDGCCRTIASAGHRRGAQMAILRVDHPDIEEFIRAKQSNIKSPVLWNLVISLPEDDPNRAKAIEELQSTNELTGFNMSIAVTDEFMLAVENDGDFNLRWEKKVYKTIKARLLWEQIMRATWDWGEPGVFFIDTVNKMNNLWYCEDICASNPCGEQPLPPNGACLLGSFNLTQYIEPTKKSNKWEFNWKAFKESIPPVVRAMDNVVDRAIYPLPEQELEAKSKRRMGLGITGLANAGEALGFPYASQEFLQFTSLVMETLTVGAYNTSIDLAKEKGVFPLFDKEKYIKGHFITRLSSEIQERIYNYGIRNSHLISIAPTGTISLGADNISSGGEPVFDYMYDRRIMKFDGYITETVEDYGLRVFGVKGKRAVDCSAEDHVNVLLTLSRYVDSAVSKTCNIEPNISWKDFKNIYFQAWKGGAKGCTTFNPRGKRSGILITSETTLTACYTDPGTGIKECE